MATVPWAPRRHDMGTVSQAPFLLLHVYSVATCFRRLRQVLVGVRISPLR
jgi:hypothetical protein